MNNDFIEYLYVTDQLDDFLGLKDNIALCPNCKTELLIYEGNLLYCPMCNTLDRYQINKKIYNKKLTNKQKKEIDVS